MEEVVRSERSSLLKKVGITIAAGAALLASNGCVIDVAYSDHYHHHGHPRVIVVDGHHGHGHHGYRGHGGGHRGHREGGHHGRGHHRGGHRY